MAVAAPAHPCRVQETFKMPENVRAWSVEEVGEWVSRQPLSGADGVAQSFREEEIDGRALLSYAARDRDAVKRDFGLSIGKATALFEFICSLHDGGAGATPTLEEGEPPYGEGSGSAHSPPRTTVPSATAALRLEPTSVRSAASPSAPSPMSIGELSAMRIKAVKNHARAVGVTEEQLDDAEDAEDHKGAVIKLIMACSACNPREPALRAELCRLTITKLIKRAETAGVSEELLETAEDTNNHKGAVINLILEKELEATDGALAAEVLRLRVELSTMKITKLIKRAAGSGVSEEDLEAAEDEDDHKGALIELIVRTELASSVLSSEPPRKTQLAKHATPNGRA